MDLIENLTLREYRRSRSSLSPAPHATGSSPDIPLSRANNSSLSHSGLLIRWSAARERARRLIAEYDVRATALTMTVERLSGGNQQKLLLARELAGAPRLILAHNPTRGLDIAATRFVFARLLEQRLRGAGILLIHNDLDELLAVADRVLVMYAGRLLETGWPKTTREAIGPLMLGSAA
jgi:simple sugar transport system ATP-binding protein